MKKFILLFMVLVTFTSIPAAFASVRPSQQNLQEFGYIKNIYEKNGKYYLTIDYAQFLQGDAALKAIVEDTGCSKQTIHNDQCLGAESYVNNNFYIRNKNPKLRTFPLVSSPSIIMSTVDAHLTFKQFIQIFNKSDSEYSYLKNAPYHIQLKKGIVIKIAEQYLP